MRAHKDDHSCLALYLHGKLRQIRCLSQRLVIHPVHVFLDGVILRDRRYRGKRVYLSEIAKQSSKHLLTCADAIYFVQGLCSHYVIAVLNSWICLGIEILDVCRRYRNNRLRLYLVKGSVHAASARGIMFLVLRSFRLHLYNGRLFADDLRLIHDTQRQLDRGYL